MLRAPARLQDQPPARHADEMFVQELNEPTGGVVRLHRSGKLAHPFDPVVEWEYVGAGDVEGVGQDGDHFAPGLAGGVLDVVDWVWRDVGEEEFA